jgi:hypothetical protein
MPVSPFVKWRLHDHQILSISSMSELMEVDVEMMDIMTMMEMWFARAPAQVDPFNLERPGTVWPRINNWH